MPPTTLNSEEPDMFFGHCVVVYGSLTDGVASAEMAG